MQVLHMGIVIEQDRWQHCTPSLVIQEVHGPHFTCLGDSYQAWEEPYREGQRSLHVHLRLGSIYRYGDGCSGFINSAANSVEYQILEGLRQKVRDRLPCHCGCLRMSDVSVISDAKNWSQDHILVLHNL